MELRRIWFVWGGVFTDTRFVDLEPGTEEFYGPFHDREEAVRTWQEKSILKVDIATHRLFIMEARPVEAEELRK